MANNSITKPMIIKRTGVWISVSEGVPTQGKTVILKISRMEKMNGGYYKVAKYHNYSWYEVDGFSLKKIPNDRYKPNKWIDIPSEDVLVTKSGGE